MITTHVLDTAQGRPASGIPVTLERRDGESWRKLGEGKTDQDGRLRTLLPSGQVVEAGTYRLRFETAGRSTFFPEVIILFEIAEAGGHHHVPLLLSPFGYSTYRGS